MPVPTLSAIEARVLAVLVEKQRTVPDAYPLSLNALILGCNQKSSRDPVMNVSEAEAQQALDRLRALHFIIDSSGGRVARFGHNAGRVLQIPSESVALLATLMLRGPQTIGELRINSDRMQRFADISSVEAFVHELAERYQLVVELPRRPGERETRWAHLLCGPPAADAPAPRQREAIAEDSLRERVARLEGELAELKAAVAELRGRV